MPPLILGDEPTSPSGRPKARRVRTACCGCIRVAPVNPGNPYWKWNPPKVRRSSCCGEWVCKYCPKDSLLL